MFKPAYRVKIGETIYESGTSSEVVSIDTYFVINSLCSFDIVLANTKNTGIFRQCDDVSVSLGYENNLKEIFKGKIDVIEPGISTTRISGLNNISKLLNKRINQFYEKQSAGKIAEDVASKSGVSTEKTEEGITFPLYAVDNTKTAYEQILKLGEMCGFDFYLTIENKLVFKKYEKKTTHTYNYGKNIINHEIIKREQQYNAAEVYGESSSSFKGSDTAHWLTKKNVSGKDGTGEGMFVHDLSIRDTDSAKNVAKAKLEKIKKTISGTVKVPGNPDINPGDAVKIEDMPNSGMNGEFQVKSIHHKLSKNSGFITEIEYI